MNRDKLIARIKELEETKQQLVANFNATDGALQELKRVLSELEEEIASGIK